MTCTGARVPEAVFEYSPGVNVHGLTGGVGWATSGNEHGAGTHPVVESGSLTFGNLRTAGNSIKTTSFNWIGVDRYMTTTLGAPGTTVYMSFLARALEPVGAGVYDPYFELTFDNLGYGTPGSPNFGIEHEGGGGLVDTGIAATDHVTYFLVLRSRFASGNDVFGMWVNPPGQPLPAVPDATKTDHDAGTPATINLGSRPRCQFDELRIGRTWADVSPTTP